MSVHAASLDDPGRYKPQMVTYGVRGYARDGYRVNLGCVEGLDVLALEIGIIDGKALPMIEEPG